MFTLVGVVVALGAGGFAALRNGRLARMERADAVVVSQRQASGRGGRYYTVEYVPAGSSAPVRIESSVSGLMVHGVGSRVGVYYDRDDPTGALIDSPTELWFTPIVIGASACGCWLPAGGIWVGLAALMRRRKRAPS